MDSGLTLQGIKMNLLGLNKFLERNRLNKVTKIEVHYFKSMNVGYYTIMTANLFLDLEEFCGEFFDTNSEEFVSIH